jgi:hypothetical protein
VTEFLRDCGNNDAGESRDNKHDQKSPLIPSSTSSLHWISLRFAAAAHNSTIPDDPETEFRQIRQFLADILASDAATLAPSASISNNIENLGNQTQSNLIRLNIFP